MVHGACTPPWLLVLPGLRLLVYSALGRRTTTLILVISRLHGSVASACTACYGQATRFSQCHRATESAPATPKQHNGPE